MIVSIHQPGYLPHSPFFDKIRQSDTFVFLDNVQYEKDGFTNRNRIRTNRGTMWLTVPVHIHSKPLIKDVEIDNCRDWRGKHWKSIVQYYQKAPFFESYGEDVKKVYYRLDWTMLTSLNVCMIRRLCELLEIELVDVDASSLYASGSATDLLVEICKELKADTYLSGPSGRDYLERGKFKKAGINLRFHSYVTPEYQQQGNGSFIHNLSIIDAIFNIGRLP